MCWVWGRCSDGDSLFLLSDIFLDKRYRIVGVVFSFRGESVGLGSYGREGLRLLVKIRYLRVIWGVGLGEGFSVLEGSGIYFFAKGFGCGFYFYVCCFRVFFLDIEFGVRLGDLVVGV